MRHSILLSLKHHKLTPVFFALLTEFLILATLGFLMLLSLEMLLPTFISAHINLALCFGLILFLFACHHALSIWISQTVQMTSRTFIWFLIILLTLWGMVLLSLSLLKFPLLANIIILLTCAYLGYLFRKIYLSV